MHIYDRFSGDPSAERLRYEEKMVRARVNIQQRYEIAGCSAAVFGIGLLVFLLLEKPVMVGVCFAVLAVAALVLLQCGYDEECDLYIFGFEDGKFLMYNSMYQELRRLDPGDVREIRILSAMRSTSRQKVIHRRYGDQTMFVSWGERVERDGEEQIIPDPMVVLCTNVGETDWRWIDDPIFRRQLHGYLYFVPAGENAQAFVHLIRHSTCPVIAVPGVYRRHQAQLDALFQAAGMDMKRLAPMQEDPRPGSQYPTPFNKNG